MIAVVTTVIATVLGTRHRAWRSAGTGSAGRASLNLVMFATISSPELVMGASLLSLFVALGVRPRLGDDHRSRT